MAEDISPGSPRWYLNRLTHKLLARQYHYDRYENYAIGKHPLANGDKRYVAALRDFQYKARTNYVALINESVTSKMKVTGFQFEPQGGPDSEAKKLWQNSDMDYQAPMILNSGATFGDFYIRVRPPDASSDLPTFTAEDPRTSIVEPHPFIPTKSVAALHLWVDIEDNQYKAILETLDGTYTYVAPYNGILQDVVSVSKRLAGDGPSIGGWQLTGAFENPHGITLVRGLWRPSFGEIPRCEAYDGLPIQDRMNQTILDRLVISKSQAYNQRWAVGVNKNGNKEFNPGADMVWATRDPNVKFGEFSAAQIGDILTAIRDDVGDLAAITMTPATYLLNRLVNISGDALEQDQAAHDRKIDVRKEAAGWAFEKAMKIAFAMIGDTKRATAPEAICQWALSGNRKTSDIADAYSKYVASGMPPGVAMRLLDIGSDEDRKAVQEHVEEQQAKAEQQAQLAAKTAVTGSQSNQPSGKGK